MAKSKSSAESKKISFGRRKGGKASLVARGIRTNVKGFAFEYV